MSEGDFFFGVRFASLLQGNRLARSFEGASDSSARPRSTSADRARGEMEGSGQNSQSGKMLRRLVRPDPLLAFYRVSIDTFTLLASSSSSGMLPAFGSLTPGRVCGGEVGLEKEFAAAPRYLADAAALARARCRLVCRSTSCESPRTHTIQSEPC